MARRANPKAVGAFVLGALALIIVAIAVLGSGRLFSETSQYALLFAGNVNGLRVGAPVKFKGVEIGSVTSVLLNLNIEAKPVGRDIASIRIPVIIALDQHKIISHGAVTDFSKPENLKLAIDFGLRGQLETQSFLTGLLYIDLDFHPGTKAKFYLPAHSEYQEIPTLPNAYEQAQSAASEIIQRLNKVQFDELAITATTTLKAATATLNAYKDLAQSNQLKDAIASINRSGQSISQAATSIRVLTEHLDRTVEPLGPQLQATVRATDATLKQAQNTLSSLNTALQPDSPLLYQASRSLSDISDAARAVRQLADYLNRNPAALLRGRDYQKEGNE
jgi:phospholipid/cholesterol/gamma-HCH transport system substrate-binding protein